MYVHYTVYMISLTRIWTTRLFPKTYSLHTSTIKFYYLTQIWIIRLFPRTKRSVTQGPREYRDILWNPKISTSKIFLPCTCNKV